MPWTLVTNDIEIEIKCQGVVAKTNVPVEIFVGFLTVLLFLI